jgi:hypothetical protein
MILKQPFNCRHRNLTFQKKKNVTRKKKNIIRQMFNGQPNQRNPQTTYPSASQESHLLYCSYNEMAWSENILRLSVKWMYPSNLAGVTVQLTTGSQVVHISW